MCNFKLKSLYTIDIYPNDFFKLEDEDYLVIQLARSAVQKLLARPELESRDIVGIGNYLYALERLPQKTFGVDASIIVDTEFDTEFDTELLVINDRKMSFQIREDQFYIDMLRTRIASSGEADSSYHSWIIESNGVRDINVELAALENDINESLNPLARIGVIDSSEINFAETDWVEYHTSDDE